MIVSRCDINCSVFNFSFSSASFMQRLLLSFKSFIHWLFECALTCCTMIIGMLNSFGKRENITFIAFIPPEETPITIASVSYTHLRAHETDSYLVCRLLLE